MSYTIDINDFVPLNMDLKHKVDDIDIKCKQSFDIVSNEISNIKTTMDKVGGQTDRLTDALSHLNEAMQCSAMSNRAMLVQIKEAKESFRSNEKLLKELKINDDALNAGVAMLSKMLDSQQVIIDSHDKSIREMKSSLESICLFTASRLGKVTEILEGMDSRLDALEHKNKKRKTQSLSATITPIYSPSDEPGTPVSLPSPLDLGCYEHMSDESARDGFERTEGPKDTVTYSTTVLNSILKQ